MIACAVLCACQSSSSPRASGTPATTSTIRGEDATSSTVAPEPRAPATTNTTEPATSTSAPSRILAGRTIALDPGHNGGPVPPGTVYIGNGIRHPCDSTGTANRNGLTEASLVLDVGLRVRAMLEALGARVLMTRTTNTGSGPCIVPA